MRHLTNEKVWTYSEAEPDGDWQPCKVRQGPSKEVKNYKDLAAKIAALQFHNPNHVLLLRGQKNDYKVQQNGNSTIRPSIFRNSDAFKTTEWNSTVAQRYEKLDGAERLLIERWPEPEGKRRLTRSKVIQWAILQHYEVCDTPLLDVTHSLRIAASFASLVNTTNNAYLMVLAVPQISGAVSSCAYNEIQTLRLSSLCPPSATRPHLQEGYLVGEYPELQTFNQKMNIKVHETDFGQRLIGKFHFNPQTFWDADEDFPKVPKSALYPNQNDSLFPICQQIKSQL